MSPKSFRIGADELGSDEIFHRRTTKMQPSDALNEHRLKRAQLRQPRLNQLQIRPVGFQVLFGIKQQVGFFRRRLQLTPVVITGGFPNVKIGAEVRPSMPPKRQAAEPMRQSRSGGAFLCRAPGQGLPTPPTTLRRRVVVSGTFGNTMLMIAKKSGKSNFKQTREFAASKSSKSSATRITI